MLYERYRKCGIPETHDLGQLEGKRGLGLKIIMPTREELHLVVLKHMRCLTP